MFFNFLAQSSAVGCVQLGFESLQGSRSHMKNHLFNYMGYHSEYCFMKWGSPILFLVLLYLPSHGRQPGLSSRVLLWCFPDDSSYPLLVLYVHGGVFGGICYIISPGNEVSLTGLWFLLTASSPFLDKGTVVRNFGRCSSIKWLANTLTHCEQLVLFTCCFLGQCSHSLNMMFFLFFWIYVQ